MIKYIILLYSLTISFCCVAEDIIVKRSGEIIKGNVLEIGLDEIKYKKSSNPSGPTYILSKSDIFSINYENGECDNFETPQNSEVQYVKNKENDKNRELISAINHAQITHNKSHGGIKNANLTAIWGIKENSVISDENLTLSFEKFHIGKYNEKIEGYKFKLHNESSNTIYIDLTNSFWGSSSLGSHPFFRNKTYSQTNNNGTGIGFNVGALTNVLGVGGVIGTLGNGLSIGVNHNSGNVISEYESPILVIPPYSFVYLPCEKILQDGEWIDKPYILYFYNRQI